MMYRSYSNTSKCFLTNYIAIAMVIFLVTVATPICSQVTSSLRAMKIWFNFLVKGNILVFHSNWSSLRRDILKQNKFQQYVRACTARDSAICSKNRKIVVYHRDSPNTRNGVWLFLHSLQLWPLIDFIACSAEVFFYLSYFSVVPQPGGTFFLKGKIKINLLT